jgi:multicomponent Na+:H+ antiporter subunit B
MSARARYIVFGTGAFGFAALLAWGFAGLPDFGDFAGRYGHVLAHSAVPQRHATSAIAVTTFDYRGVDTLVEEFILFTAAVGVMVLLRSRRAGEQVAAEPDPVRRPTAQSNSMRSLTTALVGPVLVLGIDIVLHGHLTPGGGFQGGVILTTAVLLVYLGGTHLKLGRLHPLGAMEAAEGVGAAGFAVIGLGGVILASAYLENFIAPGRVGYLISGGDIPLLNIVVGLEVMGALLVVIGEFLDQRLLVRKGRL